MMRSKINFEFYSIIPYICILDEILHRVKAGIHSIFYTQLVLISFQIQINDTIENNVKLMSKLFNHSIPFHKNWHIPTPTHINHLIPFQLNWGLCITPSPLFIYLLNEYIQNWETKQKQKSSSLSGRCQAFPLEFGVSIFSIRRVN